MRGKLDKEFLASIAGSIGLHVLVPAVFLVVSLLFWLFGSRTLEVVAESIPVDTISSTEFAKMTAGVKTGEKDKPKPKVDKVDQEVTPPEDAVGKITTKKELITANAAQPPKPVEKPVEKKPDPPKPVPKPAEKKPDPPKPEAKPKEESKPKDETKQEKKPDKTEDPIAEALKKQEKEKKPAPAKQEAKQPPQKPKDRSWNPAGIQAMLEDKRDSTRHEMRGAAMNASASLGTQTGHDSVIQATWKGAFVGAVRRCFNFPYNGQDADQFEVDIDIEMRPDGTLASPPVIDAIRGPSRSVGAAMAESAKRAVEQCQAYAFLPKSQYDTWKSISLTFGLKDLL